MDVDTALLQHRLVHAPATDSYMNTSPAARLLRSQHAQLTLRAASSERRNSMENGNHVQRMTSAAAPFPALRQSPKYAEETSSRRHGNKPSAPRITRNETAIAARRIFPWNLMSACYR